MGSERGLWQTFKRNVGREGVLLQRHEDSVEAGIPDVSFVASGFGECILGWIELKHTHEYPKRLSTKVRCKITQEQKDWLVRRGEMGACCCVLWQVERDYYVIPWIHVWLVSDCDRDDLRDASIFYSEGPPDWGKLWATILTC